MSSSGYSQQQQQHHSQPQRPNLSSQRTNSSDASTYSGNWDYSPSQAAAIVNQYMSPPSAGPGALTGNHSLYASQATRTDGIDQNGSRYNSNRQAEELLESPTKVTEDNFDRYMAELQLRGDKRDPGFNAELQGTSPTSTLSQYSTMNAVPARGNSTGLQPLPQGSPARNTSTPHSSASRGDSVSSIPSNSFYPHGQNEAPYPERNSSLSAQPTSPSRGGFNPSTQTSIASASTSSRSEETTTNNLSPPTALNAKRLTEDEIFSSYSHANSMGISPSSSSSYPAPAGIIPDETEQREEAANTRERDLIRREEEYNKRASKGSVRSEMTETGRNGGQDYSANGSKRNTGMSAQGYSVENGAGEEKEPSRNDRESSLFLQQDSPEESSEMSLIPPPLSSNPSSQGGGLAALTAMSALDEKGREPITFDEGLLRALCDSPYALQLVTERIKQSIASCKQFAAFLRSRAELEDKYARSSQELRRMSDDSYARGFCKAGSFVQAYKKTLEVHEALAQNRTRFASRLYEMSDELVNLGKEGERLRKLHKDNGLRYERNVQDAESYMEKAKSRFDTTAEELERILIAKEGESVRDSANITSPNGGSRDKRGLGKAMAKGLFKSKGPAQMQKQEDEVRQRMNSASEVFRKAVQSNQQAKQEYFNLHLPKILRLLKECADEIDMGTQYHMARYAYLYESTVMSDATAVSPATTAEPPGLRSIVETIDNRADFTRYMQNYNAARGPAPLRAVRKDGPYEENFMPALPPHVQASQLAQSQSQSQLSSHLNNGSNGEPAQSHSQPSMPGAYQSIAPTAAGMTFGIELSEQVVSEGTEVPKVVEKCAEAIEAYGLDQMGIYRLSGTTSKVQRLKGALDTDLDTIDVMSDEWSGDINVVASVLKQWFRELPEPLLTHALYQGFIDAARYDNDRLRHIRLHEQVNELPDANYATLKYFMGHLDKIRRKESINQMSVSNLSIVFGPTLLGAPPSMGGMNLEHMSFQCKAIETILERYREIFVEEEEAPPA